MSFIYSASWLLFLGSATLNLNLRLSLGGSALFTGRTPALLSFVGFLGLETLNLNLKLTPGGSDGSEFDQAL